MKRTAEFDAELARRLATLGTERLNQLLRDEGHDEFRDDASPHDVAAYFLCSDDMFPVAVETVNAERRLDALRHDVKKRRAERKAQLATQRIALVAPELLKSLHNLIRFVDYDLPGAEAAVAEASELIREAKGLS